MNKKIISLITSIIFLINCIYPAFISAEAAANVKFKYLDVETNTYVVDGEDLAKGKFYDLEIWLENITLIGGTVPIHFNNEVLSLVGAGGEKLNGELVGKSEVIDGGFVTSNNGRVRVTANEQTPYVSSREGLVYVDLNTSSYSNYKITSETKMFTVKFEAIAYGSTDIRVATYKEAQVAHGGEVIPGDENKPAASFSSKSVDVIDFNIINDQKEVICPVESVDIVEASVQIRGGDTVSLTANVKPAAATNKNIIWTSEDDGIAKVNSNGVVTGVAAGETVITATTEDGGFTDTCIIKVIDANTPTAPKNLRVIEQTGNRVLFEWDAATGLAGIDGYIIYRNGAEIARQDGDSCTFEDVGLTENGAYVYTVQAYKDELVSDMSEALSVKIKAPEITSIVPPNQDVFGTTVAGTFYVYYKDTNNSNGATLEVKYSEDGIIWNDFDITPVQGTSHEENYFEFTPDLSAFEGGEYYFSFKVSDRDDFSDTREVIYNMIAPPEALKGLDYQQDSRRISLSWQKAGEAYAEKYKIYRKLSTESDWKCIATKNINDREYYIDEFTTADALYKTYDYYVTVVDEFGQESPASNILYDAVPGDDNEVPEVLTISPSEQSVISGITTIKATLNDNVVVTQARLEYSVDDGSTWIRYGNAVVPSGANISIKFDTTTIQSNEVAVRVIAYDGKNYSDGLPVRHYVIDNEGPAKIEGVTQVEPFEATKATIKWNKVYDAKKYTVTVTDEAGKLVYSKDTTTNRLTVSGLTPETGYKVTVVAYDEIGNKGTESDECDITTIADDEAPVIVSVKPQPKRISSDLNITIQVKDNYALDGVKIAVTQDDPAEGNAVWEETALTVQEDKVTSKTFVYTLVIDEYVAEDNEGSVYVKFVPCDKAGLTGSSLIYEYYIDRKVPATPSGLKATAYEEGYIEVEWNPATEADFSHYVVERSENEDFSNSIVIRDNSTSVNCIDENVTFGKTYYYKVTAVDVLGQESPESEIVYATMPGDTTPPVISAINPRSGSRINLSSSIVVYASDNNEVAKIVLEYYNLELDTWEKYGEGKGDTCRFNLDGIRGDNHRFRAYAVDTANNVSEYSAEYYYIVDTVAPVVVNVQLTPGEGSISVSWECYAEDLKGISVYYKAKGASNYSLAATRSPASDNKYNCTIKGLSASKEYYIKIVATDVTGNSSSYDTELLTPNSPVRPLPPPLPELKVEITADSAMEVGVEKRFGVKMLTGGTQIKSWNWDFGNGRKSSLANPQQSYMAVGTYKVTVTVTDSEGRTATATKTIKVNEKEAFSGINLSIIDDNGAPVPNATVVLDCYSEQKTTYETDGAGRITINPVSPGTHVIGVYKNGYLPNDKSFTFLKNVIKDETIRLVKEHMVVGKLTWERADYEEIKEDIENGNIDIEDPDNHNIYKYNMTVIIGSGKEQREVPLEGYVPVNDDGSISEPIRFTDEDYTSAGMNENGGGYVKHTGYIFDFNHLGENGEEQERDGYSYDRDEQEKTNVITVYSTIPGQVTWLKELFDVKLSIQNQADERFVLDNCRATLVYPENGLSLITTMGEDSGFANTATVDMGSIPGTSSKSVKWKLRGDVEGEYDISALFDGYLTTFDVSVSQEFKSESPIKVYGREGLSCVVEYENNVTETDDYMVRVGLKNDSDLTRFFPNTQLEADGDKVLEVENYKNYIELKSGKRQADGEELHYGETIYSNYIFSKLTPKDNIIDIIMEKVEESRIDLPIKYKRVEPLTFHERRIEIFSINEDGENTPVNAIHAFEGAELELEAHVTEMFPGSEEYTSSGSGIEVYVKHDDTYDLLGVTDENGIVKFSHTLPDIQSENKHENIKITYKANRTKETSLQIQLVANKSMLDGFVHDRYGNPINKADVTVSGKTVKTDKNGKFEFADKFVTGKTTIVISKKNYKTISEEINLVSGKMTVDYNLERNLSKAKITNVKPDILGNPNNNIVIPAGLDLNETLDVTVASDKDAVSSYELRRNDDNEVVASSDNPKISFNTSKLNAGDVLKVVAISGSGAEAIVSNEYVLPIRVIEAPFVHLLNTDAVKGSKGALSGQIMFADLFEEIEDKNAEKAHWLSGDAKNVWDDLFGKFSKNVRINVGDYQLSQNTDLIIDWFKYKDFKVYVGYDFKTGQLEIGPKPTIGITTKAYNETGHSNSVILETSRYSKRTGQFGISEELQENMGWQYLGAFNNFSWDLQSKFDVKFTLGDNEWKGEFNLSVDEENLFYGTYRRELSEWERQNYFTPEYLAGDWYKSMTAANEISVPLGKDEYSEADDAFELTYNTTTVASWTNDIATMAMKSQSVNNIQLLPEYQLHSTTDLYGGYYVLGFMHPVYEKSVNDSEIQTMSLMEEFASSETVFEPVASYFEIEEQAEDSDVIDNKVFANSNVDIAGSSKPVMTYLQAGDGNGSKLVYSTLENGEWTQPQAVDSGSKADYNPDVAETANGAIVTWARLESGTKENSGEMTLGEIKEDVASHLEIAVSTFDNGWEAPVVINDTASEGVNYAPTVTAYGNGAMVAWIYNSENEMIEKDRVDSIKYAVYDGETWSAEKTIPLMKADGGENGEGEALEAGISDISLVEENGVVYMTFAVNTYEAGSSDNAAAPAAEGEEQSHMVSKKYYTMKYSGDGTECVWSPMANRLSTAYTSDSFCEFVRVDGKLEIVVISGTMMYHINPFTREIISRNEVDTTISQAIDISIAENSGTLALSWIADKDEGQKIYSAVYEPEVTDTNVVNIWSEAVEVVSVEDEYIAKNISSVFAKDGLHIVYNKDKYFVETGAQGETVTKVSSSLCGATAKINECDLAVDEIVLEDATLTSGSDARFSIAVRNTGLSTVKQYKITLESSNGQKQEYVVEEPIMGGASIKKEVALNAGEITGNITVSAEIAATNKTDANIDNNTAECDVIVMNTQIVGMECTQSNENSVIVKVKVANTGIVSAKRDIKLSAAELGVEQTVNVEILPGEIKDASFVVPNVRRAVTFTAGIITSDMEMDTENKTATADFAPEAKSYAGKIVVIGGRKAQDAGEPALLSLADKKAVIKPEASLETMKVSMQEDDEEFVIKDEDVVDTETGKFEVMAPEDSQLIVSAPGLLPRKISSANLGNDIELLAGNIVNTEVDVIDLVDLAVICYLWGTNINDKTESKIIEKYFDDYNEDGKFTAEDLEPYDFNGDGIIDIEEINIVVGNYGMSQRAYR